jgi:hypothetical protein
MPQHAVAVLDGLQRIRNGVSRKWVVSVDGPSLRPRGCPSQRPPFHWVRHVDPFRPWSKSDPHLPAHRKHPCRPSLGASRYLVLVVREQLARHPHGVG